VKKIIKSEHKKNHELTLLDLSIPFDVVSRCLLSLPVSFSIHVWPMKSKDGVSCSKGFQKTATACHTAFTMNWQSEDSDIGRLDLEIC